MTSKRAAIIAGLLTLFLILVVGVFSMLMEIIALNGVSESKGALALGIGLVFQLLVLGCAGSFAAWFSKVLIERFNCSSILAIFVAVVSGTVTGGLFSLFSIVISIVLAGIK